MAVAPKNLTVRLDEETREKLEIIAARELRPMANQIVVFIRQGIEGYLQQNNAHFAIGEDPNEYLYHYLVDSDTGKPL